jgi:hypothetical protein
VGLGETPDSLVVEGVSARNGLRLFGVFRKLSQTKCRPGHDESQWDVQRVAPTSNRNVVMLVPGTRLATYSVPTKQPRC